jgi:hypothetical protein
MSRSLLSAKLEGADRLARAVSLLLLHRPHMPTTPESTRSFTTWVPTVWLRTNMRDCGLLSVSTSAVGASVLFENSDLVDRSHGPPIGVLPGRNDLQICASIASFSLTSPSSESSNPFASWMVDVVDDSCRDCIRPRQPSISIASTLPRHDDVSTTTSFPVHQTRCVPSRSARSPPVMSSGRQRTPCQESIVVLLMPLELRHRTRYTRRALSQLAPAMDGVFTNI